MNSIRFWINNREVSAKPGQTILEAAEQAGIIIPHLCYHPVVKASGSCRLCAVEIEGERGLPASCSTLPTDDMRVQTATPKVEEFRREMLRLILQDHPRHCLGCPRDGTCELQALVAAIGIDFPYPAPSGKRPPVMPGGAYFERDYSLCVRCGRCVRVCHEVRGAKAIVFREIEGRQEVSTPFDRPLEAVGCQFCGACVDVCPVGALRERLGPYQGETRAQMLQVCEGLSDIVINLYRKEMPRKWQSAPCSLCGAGCQMLFEQSQSGDIIQVRPDPDGPANGGQACVQGRFLLKGYLQDPDRLQRPHIRENGGWQETSWDQALTLVASRLKAFAPGEVAVISDARAGNEELYLLQKFARSVLKTDGVGCLTPPGHLQCSEVLRRHLGLAAASASLDELSQADCIFALGLNPAASHPIAGAKIRGATLRGAKLLVASPYKIAIARYADFHLHCHPGSELELIAGIARHLLEQKQIDPAFAARYSHALEDLRRSLRPYDLDYVAAATGIHAEVLAEAACMVGEAASLSILYGLGFIQTDQALEALRGLITLVHLKGGLAKPGCGTIPLYGTGNLQGAWDMGVAPHLLPGQVAASGVPIPLEVPKMLNSGKVKAAYVVMEDLEGDALEALQPHLEKLDFVVVHDVRKPQFKADVILPMAAIAEKSGTLTNVERLVQPFTPVLAAPGEAKAVLPVLQELAGLMGADGFSQQGVEAVMSEIAQHVPFYKGAGLNCGPFQWAFTDQQAEWRGWKLSAPRALPEKLTPEYPLGLITRESLLPYFDGPLLAPESRAALAAATDEIEMNPADLFTLGFNPGEWVRLITAKGACEGRLAINELLPEKVVSAPAASMDWLTTLTGSSGAVVPARVEKIEPRS